MRLHSFVQHYKAHKRGYAMLTMSIGIILFFSVWLPHVLRWREEQGWPKLEAVYSPVDRDYTYRIGTFVYKNKVPWSLQNVYVMWEHRHDLLHTIYINPKNAHEISIYRDINALWTPSLIIAVVLILYSGHILLTPAIHYITDENAMDIEVDTRQHADWVEKNTEG